MAKDRKIVIPNLCKNSSVLVVVLIAELFAVVVVALQGYENFINRLGAASLYCQWISLSATAIMCFLRHRLNSSRQIVTHLAAFASMLVPFIVTEIATQKLILIDINEGIDVGRFTSYSIVAVIVSAVTLRMFSVVTTLENRNKAEMEMRFKALQSRIKPHFLFNSLNSISELVVMDPKKAEQAIDSLAILFRATLENDKGVHSLVNEINLCHRYLDLEYNRMGSRLSVEWSTDVRNKENCEVPKLLMQPLIENAIVHGVLPDGSVTVKVDIRESRSHLSIVVENAKGGVSGMESGHGIALDNIRERLFVLYDDQQIIRIKETTNSYRVLIRFPKQLK